MELGQLNTPLPSLGRGKIKKSILHLVDTMNTTLFLKFKKKTLQQ
jgi:hypothetical protein